MTELLSRAFQEAKKLPIQEQDAMARWLLEELASEQRWTRLLDSSRSDLELLGRRALAEHRKGRTRSADPEKL